jgi:hypothetical protein
VSILTRAAVYTVRIAVVIATTPVLVGAAAASATATLAGWELWQLTGSPLSAEASPLEAEYRELPATRGVGAKPGQRGSRGTLGAAARGAAPVA